MKHTFRYLTLFTFLVAFSNITSAGNNVEIELNLKKGDRFQYVITSTNKVDQNIRNQPIKIVQKAALTINQVVVGRLKNGNYLLEADYKKFKLEMNLNGEISGYNSDTLVASNNFIEDLKGMTKIHLRYEVSPSGVVSNITSMEELKKEVASNVQKANLLRDFGTDKFITQMFNYIPKEKVGVGDKWIVAGIMPELMDLKYDINYTLAEASAENIKLKIQSDFTFTTDQPIVNNGKNLKIKEDGVQNGNVTLNPKNGMPVSSVLQQEIDLVSTATDVKNNIEVTQMKLYSETSVLLVK
jgi:hypothetical protein